MLLCLVQNNIMDKTQTEQVLNQDQTEDLNIEDTYDNVRTGNVL